MCGSACLRVWIRVPFGMHETVSVDLGLPLSECAGMGPRVNEYVCVCVCCCRRVHLWLRVCVWAWLCLCAFVIERAFVCTCVGWKVRVWV